MNVGTAIARGFRLYFRHGGRARRSEFWWFYLTLQVGSFVVGGAIGVVAALAVPSAFTASGELSPGLELFGRALGLLVLVGVLNASTRRLHDVGRSGWWNLLLITVIGIVVLIVFWCLDSSWQDNRYGPSPKVVPRPPR